MAGLGPFKLCHQMALLLRSPTLVRPRTVSHQAKVLRRGRLVVKACQEEGQKSQRRSFLSLEEAGLVEMSGLNTHERFLCRLTISSLNLLRVISEQEGVPIEELNAGRLCDWFLKDKLKREQDLGSAVIQWDDSDSQF
ncbi:hypothetical protein C4D60_Mb05t00700 [Musa balbisiana]|uniref:Uncharacterized protein n=1 Tax=Musa balbisiana TaxID=52838 RepID=A0A4S8JSQ9_MUSBA|nr:hypothetical protein C4D60_Mb05t00700 [Musa balbisiana]